MPTTLHLLSFAVRIQTNSAISTGALRPGDVHSGNGWSAVLEPVIAPLSGHRETGVFQRRRGLWPATVFSSFCLSENTRAYIAAVSSPAPISLQP